MNTTNKFTLIVSAYQSHNSVLQNMLATAAFEQWLLEDIRVEYERGIGVYKDKAEQSFVINTNSKSKVNMIITRALEYNGQDCVLLSRNRDHLISLVYPSGKLVNIGHNFVGSLAVPKQGHGIAKSYTVLNGTEFYIVR